MVKSIKNQSNSTRKSNCKEVPEPVQAPPTLRPGGKLGLMLERLSAKSGATADELVAATGWQRHSVLGALSRLRTRGFAMRFDNTANRKAYRLDVMAKPSAQQRAKG